MTLVIYVTDVNMENLLVVIEFSWFYGVKIIYTKSPSEFIHVCDKLTPTLDWPFLDINLFFLNCQYW